MTLTSHQRPHRGASDVWLTPPNIIEAVGPFDLDPCGAPIPRPWDTAAEHITLPADGLASDWRGFVWCNPPFGPEAARWLAKMADHRNGIALVPARTETRWFVAHIWSAADAVLFLHGRPHFHHANGERARRDPLFILPLRSPGTRGLHPPERSSPTVRVLAGTEGTRLMARQNYDPEAAYREWIHEACGLLRELADRERLAFGQPLPETLDAIRRGEDLV